MGHGPARLPSALVKVGLPSAGAPAQDQQTSGCLRRQGGWEAEGTLHSPEQACYAQCWQEGPRLRLAR